MTLYDAIGTAYTRTRIPDPRIASAIEHALGDAATVLNVGAGTGSYERIVIGTPANELQIQGATVTYPRMPSRACGSHWK